jgi:DnaJ-class molecular chaperone
MLDLAERRCGYCDGSGLVNVGESVVSHEPCPICTGRGKVRVPSSYRTCPICGGTGKRDVGEFAPRWVRCKNCQGTGWREPPPAHR